MKEYTPQTDQELIPEVNYNELPDLILDAEDIMVELHILNQCYEKSKITKVKPDVEAPPQSNKHLEIDLHK